MPGVLKYFIDHLKFPESFEYRPVCFVGIGSGAFGGLRPVEHLQQVFGYRNAFIFPERVFVMNAHKVINAASEVTDPLLQDLFLRQAKGFQKFSKALVDAKLDANSFIAGKKK
ncbi:NADPH-dependent FMN reductase [compost metagenome]